MQARPKGIVATGLIAVFVAFAIGPVALALSRALLALAVIGVGLRKFPRDPGSPVHPWRRICFGGLLALFAALVRATEGLLRGQDYPFPSVADLVAYCGYGMMLLGGVALVRSRTVERSRDDFLDALIAGLLAGLLVYAFVLDDYLADASVPILERLTNLGYSALVVMLVGVTARVSFGPGERNPSYYLLAAATGSIVVNDTLVLASIAGVFDVDRVAALVGTLAFVFGLASVAHPDARRLTDRPRHSDTPLAQRRVLLLFVALLMGPSLIILEGDAATLTDRAVAMAGTGLLAVCVLVRMVQLVRARERWADREQALRDLGSELVAAHARTDVFLSASRLVGRLLGPSDRLRVTVYDSAPGGGLVAAHSVGSRAGDVVGLELGIRALPPDVLHVLQYQEPVALELVPSLEGLAGEEQLFMAAVPIVSRHDAACLLVITADRVISSQSVAAVRSIGGQVGLALDSLRLSEQLHHRRSNRRFRALVENSSDVVLVLDDSDEVSFASPTVRRLLGRNESDVLHHPVLDLVHRPDQVHVRRLLAAPARHGSERAPVEVRLLHGSGELRWFEIEARDLTSEEEVQGIVMTARDISDRRRAEAQLLRSEARFRLMVQNSSDVVAIVDDDLLVTYVSPSVERMLGFAPAEVLGRNVFELLSITEAERIRGMDIAELSGSTIEVRMQGADGRVRAVEVGVTDMRSQPEVDGVVLNIRDVTERKSLEDDLRHQALHDDLTGLANRTLFAERIREAMRGPHAGGELLAVLFVDLDDFKLINDSLGHAVGDQVLVAVADRIQQCLRLSDVAARFGGDEFAVLLTGVYGESEILQVADRLRTSIGQPLRLADNEFRMTASIGIVSTTDGSKSDEDLLRSADLAMYQAKQSGKDRYEIFQEHMAESAFEELELKTALNRALENDEFVVHYQPIVDLATSEICGVEALIRWEDPRRGMVSPASFIPTAEETGLIRPIGMWVAAQAAKDLVAWREAGFDLYCSINVSGRQLGEDDFAAKLIDQVLSAGADPTTIVVELTESVLADEGVAAVFDAFHDVGFRIALDDFGTGYSALQYLQTFDIDLIKIDRSFVKAMDTATDAGVVQAVIDVARRIDAKAIAEGIEDSAELRQLRQLGVQFGQGYYFSRPLPAEKLRALLDDQVVSGTNVALP